MEKRNQRPRLLITGKAYDPHIGGIETVMQQTAEYMRRYAKTKVLCCRDDFGLTKKEKVHGVPVTYAGSFGTVASCPVSLSYFGEFRRKVMLSDAVELHLPFPLCDLALLLSGYKGRVIVAWHSDVIRQKALLRLYRPLRRRLLKRADAILVATKAHIDSAPDLQQFRDKCVVVPYGIDPAEYEIRPHLHPYDAHLYDKNAKKSCLPADWSTTKARIYCSKPLQTSKQTQSFSLPVPAYWKTISGSVPKHLALQNAYTFSAEE